MNMTGKEDAEAVFLAEIGAKIRALRTDREYTQEALAVRAGCSRGLIANIERGHNAGSLRTLFWIAEALNVPVKSLLPDQSPATLGSTQDAGSAADVVDLLQAYGVAND